MPDRKGKTGVKAILTPVFRASFVDISTKNDMSDKYKIVMMFEKGTDLTTLLAMAKKARAAKWPNNPPKGFLNPSKKVDDMEKDGKYDGYEDGMVILSASSSRRVGVVDRQKNEIELDDLDTYLYSGCYCLANITAFAYDTKGNKGVSFGLNAIMVMRDGEPLGSRMNPDQAFADVEDDDDHVEPEEAAGDDFDL